MNRNGNKLEKTLKIYRGNIMAESNIYTVQLEEDENGDLVLPFTDEILEELGWKVGDQLVWKDNGDGTYTISKDQDDILGDVVYGEGC